MPFYELAYLFKHMEKPLLLKTVHRSAGTVMDFSGYIRSIRMMFSGELAGRAGNRRRPHTHGSIWQIECDMPSSKVEALRDFIHRDEEVVRFLINVPDRYTPIECQFHEETQPAPLRPDVKSLVQLAEQKADKKRIRFNHGLNYYPFQR